MMVCRFEHARELLTQDLGRVEGASTAFAWNHEEFSIEYLSLESHLCVGGIFVRDALEALSKQEVTVDELFALVPDTWEYVVTLYRTMLESSTLSTQDEVALLNMMELVFNFPSTAFRIWCRCCWHTGRLRAEMRSSGS
jgi:hypothetical protein